MNVNFGLFPPLDAGRMPRIDKNAASPSARSTALEPYRAATAASSASAHAASEASGVEPAGSR